MGRIGRRIGPALAAREQLAQGDVVTLEAAGRRIEGPVWILPGQADGTVGVTLGYGRSVPDRIAYDLGYDAYKLRAAADPWRLAGAMLQKSGRTQRFATTQDHSTMEGHDFVRVQQVGAAPVGDTTAFTQPTLFPPKADDPRRPGADRLPGRLPDPGHQLRRPERRVERRRRRP